MNSNRKVIEVKPSWLPSLLFSEQLHEIFTTSRIKLAINIKRVYRRRPGRVFCITRLWSLSISETPCWLQELQACVLCCCCTSDVPIGENIKDARHSLGLLSYFHALISQINYSPGIGRDWKDLNYRCLFLISSGTITFLAGCFAEILNL